MVQHIDFLPAAYRQTRRHQHRKVSRRFVLVVFLGMIIAGTWQQRHIQARLQGQRDRLRNQAARMSARLDDADKVRQQIDELEIKANLITRLRVRVPSTRLLAAMTECLPTYVRITQCRSTFSSFENKSAGKSADHAEPAAEAEAEAETEAPLAEATDLKMLHERDKQTALFVSLSGVAPDDVAISHYIQNLELTNLFDEITLLYTDQLKFQEQRLRSFEMRIRVKKPSVANQPASDSESDTTSSMNQTAASPTSDTPAL